MNRREFLQGMFAALGFSALPGGWLFAAPSGWKPKGKPNLVFGVVSDTHLRTANKGNGIGANWPDKYFAAALEYFKAQGVDAVVHCGDFAHRGQVREMEFHAEAWRRVFADGREPEKLFVAGNHDLLGADYGDFVKNRYPDEAELAKHVLATDMAANWERIWGEKYEPVWHKDIKGYHFFGRQWGVDEGNFAKFLRGQDATLHLADGIKPFFLLSHARSHKVLYRTAAKLRNSVSFFGHRHHSAANWNKICFWGCPNIHVPCCEPRGGNGLSGEGQISKARLDGKEAGGRSRQGYVVRVYDDMMTIERREFGEGGSLGADWVMPFEREEGKGKRKEERIKKPHPFSKGELKKAIGEPQFRKGAKLIVEDVSTGLTGLTGLSGAKPQTSDNLVNPVNPVQENSATPRLRVRIPLANGNPSSRVYAYEVVVAGDEGTRKLHKAVYAVGCNMGIGHEPNGGVTTLEIAKDELPPGKSLTFAVRPITSLGTSGRPIITDFKV
jgi:predicted phosphodiesterase